MAITHHCTTGGRIRRIVVAIPLRIACIPTAIIQSGIIPVPVATVRMRGTEIVTQFVSGHHDRPTIGGDIVVAAGDSTVSHTPVLVAQYIQIGHATTTAIAQQMSEVTIIHAILCVPELVQEIP